MHSPSPGDSSRDSDSSPTPRPRDPSVAPAAGASGSRRPREGRPDALAQFRGDAKASKRLHPLERALLFITGAHLVFLPWALGTMQLWSQTVSFALALLGFAVSLWPRHYTEEYSDEGRFRLLMWPRLLRFPLFWLGLAFFALIIVQALNPAWDYTRVTATAWTLRPRPHVEWLPSSVYGTPFQQMTPWRALMLVSTVWMVASSLWIGATRRTTLQLLLGTLAVNGAVLALLGLVQRLTGTREIFWSSYRPPAAYFVATFIYKNHAGAYFNLVLAVCLALTVWYAARARRRGQKSGPGLLYGFLAILAVLVVVVSYSRTATLLAFGFLAVLAVAWVIRLFRHPREYGHPLIGGATALLLVAFLGAGLYVVGAAKAYDKFEALFEGGREARQSIGGRQFAARAAFDMASTDLLRGHGAGSFRYVFPQYQRKYPEITYISPKKKKGWLFWEHAHNDYAEFLAEYGLIGAALLLGAFGSLVAMAVRRRAHAQAFALILAGGLALTLAHSWVDFQAHNPAILVTWAALTIAMLRWAELNRTTEVGGQRSEAGVAPRAKS